MTITAEFSPAPMELVIVGMTALVFVATVGIVFTVGVAFLRDRVKSRSERQEGSE